MEKQMSLNLTLLVDDYQKGLEVGDLLTELLENLAVLSEGVYACHVEYEVNGMARDELIKFYL